MTPATLVRRAFLRACRLDVAVRKPGNVSRASPGHGMQAQQFVDSAIAAADGLCVPGLPVGERIERAVAASFAAAGCNTNLGIVLLAAPLAAAAERPWALDSAAALRGAVQQVLAELTRDDAAAAFRAIALARPGGLGRAEAQDVHEAPQVDLHEAMVLAAERDSIARQYAQGCADLFEVLLPAFAPMASEAADAWLSEDPDAPGPGTVHRVQRVYLRCLVSWPDTHIVRKWSIEVAREVAGQARRWLDDPRPDADPAFAEWDALMKVRGWNPGTSADLTVATLLTAGMLADAASMP